MCGHQSRVVLPSGVVLVLVLVLVVVAMMRSDSYPTEPKSAECPRPRD